MATASDPFVAAEHIRREVPDVIMLDVEMPRMDGLTFLQKIMSQHPIPVVICSSLTESGSETALRALEYGAVEIILKPRLGAKQFLEESRIRICDAVKAAARAQVKRLPAGHAGGRRRSSPPTRCSPRRGSAGRACSRPRRRSSSSAPPPAGPRRSGLPGGPAAGRARHRHRAAHAGELHHGLRPAAGQHLPDLGQGGGEQRHGDPGPRAHRPRQPPSPAQAQRRPLLSSRSRTARSSAATGRRWTCCSGPRRATPGPTPSA